MPEKGNDGVKPQGMDDPKGGLGRFKGVAGLVTFSTILPLNIYTSIEEMAEFTWLWPVIGAFIGITTGAVGFLVFNVMHTPQLIAAAIVYSFAIWFTGFHHLDGLMDLGDAMMVHGTPEKRISVMRDTNIGTGGIAYLLMVALLSFAALGSAPVTEIFYILVISEIAAKMGIATCATLSNPFSNGTGRFFIDAMNIKLFVLSFIVALSIGFLTFNFMGVLGVIGGSIGGAFIAIIVRKNLKWATGDVLGASNEFSRMLSLVVMASVLAIV